MSSNCIYEVFEWILVVYKYLGNIPLPGLYEWKGNSKIKSRLLFSIVLPLLVAISAIFGAYIEFSLGFTAYIEHDLTNILVCLIIITMIVSSLITPPILYFRFSKNLIHYLKKHQKIDHLLKPQKNRFKFVANSLFIFTLINNLIFGLGFGYGDRLLGSEAISLTEHLGFVNSTYAAICMWNEPQTLYILSHYVLRCAFAQLLREIEDEKKEKSEMKLREYGTLYCHLCRMGKQLDHMTSPLIVIQFLECYLLAVFDTVFITDMEWLKIINLTSEMVFNGIVLVLVPYSAQETKNLISKIRPKIFSRFDSNDHKLKKEMEIFAIQTLQFQAKFSASGLFNLDRKLILSVFQSILSQWVVFYKLKHNRK